MADPTPPTVSRRAMLLAGGGAVTACAACTALEGVPSESSAVSVAPIRLTSGRTAVLPSRPTAEALRAASQAFFDAAAVVVVADPNERTRWPAAARVAGDLGIPVLLADDRLTAELDRLGATEIISYADPALPLGERRIVPGPDSGRPHLKTRLPHAPAGGRAVLLTEPGTRVTGLLAATARAAGATILAATAADPRADPATVTRVRDRPDATVVGVGTAFGDADRFAARVHTARTAPELPGGGILALPANHFIAIYGHPGTPSLGLLGEQDAEAAVTRVRDLVAQYAALVPGPVRPAFELIATVAANLPGPDGSYSIPTDPALLDQWIGAAEAAGVYCILDLQPGRADFLTQARRYADQLARPGVGLALDSEWRLQPGELPLTRIGHVGADEVNAVADWLAELVRAHDLPPKLLILHQFQMQMLPDRDRIDLTRDELQIVIHVDGSGGQGAKQSTWRTVRAGLSPRVFLGWKNFVDEDAPMLTPAQTVAEVAPLPSLITYQ